MCVCVSENMNILIFSSKDFSTQGLALVCKVPFQFKMSKWTQTVNFKCPVSAVSWDPSLS